MPNTNWRFVLAPLASGAPSVADMLLLKPPPFTCDGGCSNVVPPTVAEPPPLSGTEIAADVRGRRSATPAGDGNVESSIMRKRKRVKLAPLLLVNFRRKDNEP